ncbi:MAG: hypothetical protein ACKO1F_10060 [Flammeovirgaceae bacterium]
MNTLNKTVNKIAFLAIVVFACRNESSREPHFELTTTKKFVFNSFVDCNMAEAWIGDTLRIFPGK